MKIERDLQRLVPRARLGDLPAPADLARPAGLHRAGAAVRGLRPDRPLPVREPPCSQCPTWRRPGSGSTRSRSRKARPSTRATASTAGRVRGGLPAAGHAGRRRALPPARGRRLRLPLRRPPRGRAGDRRDRVRRAAAARGGDDRVRDRPRRAPAGLRDRGDRRADGLGARPARGGRGAARRRCRTTSRRSARCCARASTRSEPLPKVRRFA